MEQDVCEFCHGTGYVTNVEYDNAIHEFVPAGLIECKHPGQYDNN